MTNEEAAWLAGILEGEACFDWNRGTNGNKRWPRIRVEMRDEDVIQHVKSVTQGRAVIHKISRANPKHSDTFSFMLARRDEVRYVLEQIRPWMSSRRGLVIDEMLEVLDVGPVIVL